jgi:hypothetical protein
MGVDCTPHSSGTFLNCLTNDSADCVKRNPSAFQTLPPLPPKRPNPAHWGGVPPIGMRYTTNANQRRSIKLLQSAAADTLVEE